MRPEDIAASQDMLIDPNNLTINTTTHSWSQLQHFFIFLHAGMLLRFDPSGITTPFSNAPLVMQVVANYVQIDTNLTLPTSMNRY